MRDGITDTQKAAARALVEGEPATHGRVAAAMGVHTTTLAHWAGEEGWTSLDFRRPRVRRAQRALVALAAAAREGREIDETELFALSRTGDEEGMDEAARDAVAAVAGAFHAGPEGPAGSFAPAGERAEAAGFAGAAPKPLPELPPAERAARLRAMLTARMEEMLRRAENGRPVEGRQVQALAALAQLAEKIAPAPMPGFLLDGERELTAEEVRERNERTAEALKKIDDRIAYLSTGLAAEILVKNGMSEAEAEKAVMETVGWTPEEIAAGASSA